MTTCSTGCGYSYPDGKNVRTPCDSCRNKVYYSHQEEYKKAEKELVEE